MALLIRAYFISGDNPGIAAIAAVFYMRKWHGATASFIYMARYIVLFTFAALWVFLWLNNATPAIWFVENIVVFLFIPVLLWMVINRTISFLSLSLTILFLSLHLIGAQHGYGFVPVGNRIADLFGVEGNFYDRFVHFSFGILMAYPIYEMLKRGRIHYTFLITISLILAFSAVYEIAEWVATLHLRPDIAARFIGGTDPFDAQKDMLLAGIGSVCTTAMMALVASVKKAKLSYRLNSRYT